MAPEEELGKQLRQRPHTTIRHPHQLAVQEPGRSSRLRYLTPALQQLQTQSLWCSEYQISGAASQNGVNACDNEQSHVPRNRRVPGTACLAHGAPLLGWAFPACTMLALQAAALAKSTTNTFLHMYKPAHRPPTLLHLTAALMGNGRRGK